MVKLNKKFILLVLLIIVVIITAISIYVTAGSNNDEVKSIWTGKMHDFHDSSDNIILLPDERVLLIGKTAEIFDPKKRNFKTIQDLWPYLPSGAILQHSPKATMLKDGKILLTGSVIFQKPKNYTLLKTAEILDSKTGEIKKVGDMNFGRAYHVTTLLKDGKVLITGKDNSNKKAELFDPATNKFTLILNEMIYPRVNHTATLMNNGDVLLAAGALSQNNTYYPQAEIYDPQTNSFYEVGSLNINRIGAMASLKSVLLDNGDVLVCGGCDPNRDIGLYKRRHIPCEIFDHKTQKFRLLDNFNEPRYNYGLTKLPDGRVLITGGIHGEKYKTENIIDSIEIFDPNTEKFTTVGKMRKTRGAHLAVLLNDNTVMLVGGCSMVIKNDWELFLPLIYPDSHNKDAEILEVNNIGDK